MSELSSNEYSVRIAVLETRLHAADEARRLQAAEYERRLDLLNHAHQKALEERTVVVSRELFDAGMRESKLLTETVRTESRRDRDATETRINGLSAKIYTGVGIVMALQVVIYLALEFWKK
jgi:hypothetical protein